GDVTRREDVAGCVRLVKQRHGALHGIFHAAGITRDGLLRRKNWTDVSLVLGPKVHGAVLLDEATAEEPLDFFVLFSSVASMGGNIGQGDYAYANGFLDAFAEARENLRARGLRRGLTVSINWPLWAGGGLKPPPELLELKTRGMAPLETAVGLQIFETALRSGEPRIAGLLLTPDAAAPESPAAQGSTPPSATMGVGLEQVLTFLKSRFSDLTKIPADRLQPSEPLERYGIDSILVLSFTVVLEQDFGSLSKTLLFEHQTLESLARYFLAEHTLRLAALFGDPSATPVINSPLVTVDPPLSTPADSGIRSGEGTFPVEGIAIVGLFGRFPMAGNPDEFWDNLISGRDCITEVPEDRWDYRAYFEPKPSPPGKTYNRWGGFLKDVDKFDPAFFRIPPKEAEFMDPQERLFLETVWRTLEDAGYRKSALRQKPVGVFVGIMYGQYQLLGLERSRPGQMLSLNASYASIANRVSYFFDWTGPSLALDSMCSSSLTAIHLACASLAKGESEYAIAGGVNLLLHPSRDVGLAQGGFAAADGRCKSFGAGGDGYVPGEGVAAVLLKPLSRAVAAGDHVYAVIKATSINHGGKTNGYTVPNPNAQAALIADSLRKAAIDPRTITCVEAHGTGTSLGDPIEVTGLTQAFQLALGPDQTLPRHFCALGSVKSNIGHLEAAAGVAGLVKVLLQLQHCTLVPSLHARPLNPHIVFADSPFAVQHEAAPWHEPTFEQGGKTITCPRRAGISSFGAGGANAHVIIEEFSGPPPAGMPSDDGPVLLVLSAANSERLSEVARSLLVWVTKVSGTQNARPGLREIAYTLQVGREGLEERVAFTVSSWADLSERLATFADTDRRTGFIQGNARLERGTSAAIMEGEEGRQFLQNLIRNGQLVRLARLWVGGVEIPWEDVWAGQRVRRVSLPGYPFSRERYWVPADWRPEPANLVSQPRLHPLLHRNESTLRTQVYRSTLETRERVFQDHLVNGEPMLPGTASVEMILTAGMLALTSSRVRLKNVSWEKPIIGSDGAVAVEVVVTAQPGDCVTVELGTPAGGRMVRGKAETVAAFAEDVLDLAAIKARCSQSASPDQIYREYELRGLKYGPGFRVVQEINYQPGEVCTLLQLPDVWPDENYRLHPALTDGAFQSLGVIVPEGGEVGLPYGIEAVECTGPLPRRCWAYGRLTAERTYDVTLLEESGRVLARLTGLRTRPAQRVDRAPFYYRPVWKPVALQAPRPGSVAPLLLLDTASE
ncbi:MAG TPA: beta-ketoacyl synthase N-terminal-like domain-containing protein, partial [Chthoniobacterales bacterium]